MREIDDHASERTRAILLDDYRLGDWRVRPRNGTLERGEQIERLGPKPMEVLGVLAAATGQTVAHDEIFRAVWGDQIVESGALARSVSEIRKILGDDARKPTYIQTVPKRGYRLVAPVADAATPVPMARPPASTPPPPSTSSVPPVSSTATSPSPSAASPSPPLPAPAAGSRPRAIRWAVAALIVLATVWAASARLGTSVPRVGVLPPVLPEPSDASHELAESLAQLLPLSLSRATGGEAEIIPLEGTAAAGAPPTWARTRGRHRIDYWLYPRVENENRFVRVSLSLRRVADGAIIWSQSVPVESDDLDVFTRDVARDVAAALDLEAPEATGPAATEPRDAEYRRGLRLIDGALDFDDVMSGVEELHDVLRRDPEHAPAHAALARAYLRLRMYPGDRAGRVRIAERAARRALELDPESVDARLALAKIDYFYRFDRAAAEARLRRTIELRPAEAEAYFLLAFVLSAAGRHDEAIRAVERGREWAPATQKTAWRLVVAHSLARQPKRALAVARAHYRPDAPPEPAPSLPISFAFELARNGHESEALGVVNTFLAARGDRPAGSWTEFLRRFRWSIITRQTMGFEHRASIAILSALLGEHELALEQAIEACETRSGWLAPLLGVDPRVDALRELPGYERLRVCLDTPVRAVPFEFPRGSRITD